MSYSSFTSLFNFNDCVVVEKNDTLNFIFDYDYEIIKLLEIICDNHITVINDIINNGKYSIEEEKKAVDKCIELLYNTVFFTEERILSKEYILMTFINNNKDFRMVSRKLRELVNLYNCDYKNYKRNRISIKQ